MLTGLLIIVIVALLGVLSHRRTRLERKILKHVPIAEWIVIFILPICFYIGWVFIVKSIISRENIKIIPLDDIDVLVLTNLFMVYGFVGNAIHFVAKIMWRYIENKRSMAYRVNEMFHGKFSHYLIDINGLFIIFMMVVLEVNHPINYPLSTVVIRVLVLFGFVLGLSMRRYIFYTNEWFGGYNKPIIFVVSAQLSLTLLFFRLRGLNLSFYPVTFFIVFMISSFIAAFIFRQLFIFTRLDEKRRLRFLGKIFSV